MGMFDKDKEIGLILTRAFEQGEHFVVFSARVAREDFPTALGPSPQAVLEVAKLSEPRQRFDVTTLASAIVTKVREAEPDDFPARVFWTLAPSQKWQKDVTVLQFVAPFTGGGTTTPRQDPPATAAAVEGDPGPTDRPPVEDDDIPF